MKQDLGWASTLEWMYPFELQIKLQAQLYHVSHRASLKSLREFGLQGTGLVDELRIFAINPAFWKASANIPSTFERQYHLAKHYVHTIFTSITAAQTSLWDQCASLISFPGNARFAISRSGVPLGAFKTPCAHLPSSLVMQNWTVSTYHTHQSGSWPLRSKA